MMLVKCKFPYDVFGGTLNLARSNQSVWKFDRMELFCCVYVCEWMVDLTLMAKLHCSYVVVVVAVVEVVACLRVVKFAQF